MNKNHQTPSAKLLVLAEILSNINTPESALTTNEIISKLSEYNVGGDDSTLKRQIDKLREHGYDISTIKKGKSNAYYMNVENRIEDAELKVIIDLINNAYFLSPQKTKELISRVLSLGDAKQKSDLAATVNDFYPLKSKINVWPIINELTIAITQRHQVSFKYSKIVDDNGNLVLKNAGKPYVVSPLLLTVDNGFYYLIAIKENNELRTFRIDRIKKVDQTDKLITVDRDKWLQKLNHTLRTSIFNMYIRDNPIDITISFHQSYSADVISRFDCKVKKIDNMRQKATIKVIPDNGFYSWLMLFGGDIKIEEPKEESDKFIEHINKILSTYQTK